MRYLSARLIGLSLLAASTYAHPYIDTLVCPLDQFNGTFQVIAEGTVEKVDAGRKIGIIKVGKILKGKTDITHIRVNVGAAPDWHPDAAMPHLVPGAPVLLWYYWGDGPKAAIYINRFFMETYRNQDGAPPEPGKVWWHFSAVATLFNRTYSGSAEELAQLLPSLIAGRKGPAPDQKRPPITRESLAALPVWGKPVDPSKLPLPFRPRRSAANDKPREPDPAGAVLPGLSFRLYEGTHQALPDFAKLTPVKSGVAKSIDLAVREREAGYALRFSGFLEVPKDGVYTFTLVSNDGAALSIGETEVVNNDHFKSVIEGSGEIALKAGKHALTVGYFQHSGFQVLEASWEAPGLSRQAIPATALFRRSTP
jgi:hypothetical protein